MSSAVVSAVIVSWNTRELLRDCLRSLFEQDHGVPLQVVVVDNASADGTAEMVADEFPRAVLVASQTNTGYAAGNNLGFAQANGDFVMILNPDTEIQGSAIRDMVEFLQQQREYGGVSPQLILPDGSVQQSCMRFPNLKVAFLFDSVWDRMLGKSRTIRHYFMEDFDHRSSADVDQPPGSCLMLRREVLDSVQGFDEKLFLFFNDVDLCRRIHDQGWKIRFLADARLLHHHGQSTSQYPDFVREWNFNRIYYYRKHFGGRGALVVKVAVFTRGLEEVMRTFWKTPWGQKWAATRYVVGLLASILRS